MLPVDGGNVPLNTYHELLLENPGMHPLLRERVERLAAEETAGSHGVSPAAALAVEPQPESPAAYPVSAHDASASPSENSPNDSELGRINENLRGRSREMFGEQPVWRGNYYIPDDVTRAAIKRGEFTTEALADFIHEASQLCDAYEDVANRRGDGSGRSWYGAVTDALAAAPADKLREVYHTKTLSSDLRHMLEQSYYVEELIPATEIARNMYGFDDLLELYQLHGSALNDETVQALLEKDNIVPAMASALNRKTALWPEGMDPAEETTAKRDWGDRFLAIVAELPKDIRRELWYTAYSRTSDSKTGQVDSDALRIMLTKVGNKSRWHAEGWTSYLREHAGIINFDYYSSEQLELTAAALGGHPDTIRHLQAGDTTVVFTDAQGDYNGALSTVGENYATHGNRTLVFEINEPGDLQKYMLKLVDLGIKPSTIVLAAHGLPGSLNFGRDGSKFAFVNRASLEDLFDPSNSRLNVADEAGLSPVLRDIIQNMMQDSLGIDDNPEAKGRRRLIFNACYQAKAREAAGDQQPKRRFGMRKSRRRRPAEESMAETVTRIASTPSLDVYANEEGIGHVRTSDGVSHVVPVDMPSKLDVGTPLPATHFRLNRFGNVVKRRIESIQLRRDDSEYEEAMERAA